MADDKIVNIEIPVLARVEGEGALELAIQDGKIEKLNLRIFEPPRFFEKLVVGRNYAEVPDIVARICGICPVAYQMSAVAAIESIFDIKPGSWVHDMRKLMYFGEWIESHALHIHMLAAPDFLGFNDVIATADKFPDEVRRGLQLQALGNRLIKLLGGRSVHPVGVRIGGFYSAPTLDDVMVLLGEFEAVLVQAEELLLWVASFEFPEDNQSLTCVATQAGNEYPIMGGNIVTTGGLNIAIDEYQQYFVEEHVPHSTALYSYLDGKPYLVGPLARINLNVDKIPNAVFKVLEKTSITFPSNNMFHSVVARAIELYVAVLGSIKILKAYYVPDKSSVDVKPKAGIGFGCTEAPRGILWHRYELDEQGQVVHATIVPPTSQNQARIEQDLETSLNQFGLSHDEDSLRQHSEKVIRNYDPCISCATHFLKIKVDRR